MLENIEIHDDGDELTLYLGKFTHLHISNYDDQLNEEQKAQEIVRDTVAFLSDVFDDEVVFWGSHRGGGGTYRLGHTHFAFSASGSAVILKYQIRDAFCGRKTSYFYQSGEFEVEQENLLQFLGGFRSFMEAQQGAPRDAPKAARP